MFTKSKKTENCKHRKNVVVARATTTQDNIDATKKSH